MTPDKHTIPFGRNLPCSMPVLHRRILFWAAVFFLLSACASQPGLNPNEAVAVGVQPVTYPQDFHTLQPAASSKPSALWTDFTDGNNLSTLLVGQDSKLWSAGNGGVIQWDPLHDTYHKYTTADGLPANRLTALTQTPGGMLWAGSQNGHAASFDGKRWQVYSHLIGETISAMAVSPDGSVWFGTNRGVVRFNSQAWSAYTAQNGLSGGEVKSLFVDQTGRVWAATATGLASFEQGQWRKYAFPPGTRVASLAQTKDGVLWAGSDGRLFRLEGEKWQTIDFQQGLDYAQIGRINALAVAPDGSLWLSTPGYLVDYDGQSWKAFRTGEGQPLATLAFDSNGNLWAGGAGSGLVNFSKGKWQVYRTADVLGGNTILSLATGANGAVWAGTNRGALHFTGQAWQTFSSANSLPDNQVLAIAVAPDGSTWFGTQSGAVHLQAGDWITYTAQSGYNMAQVAHIAITGDGSLWFATQQGAWLYDADSGTLYPAQSNLPDIQIQDVATGPHGSIWFLTPKGIVRFKDNRWLPVNFPDQEYITCLAVAANSDLWLGTRDHGVYRLNAEIWDQFSTTQADKLTLNPDGSAYYLSGTDLLPLNGKFLQHYRQVDGLQDDTVNALAIAPNGAIWAGTDNGAGRFKDGAWQSFGLGSGLGAQKVRALAVAPDGTVWFGLSLGGIARYLPP
jgi:ligand-binding sensor domain-containing protein